MTNAARWGRQTYLVFFSMMPEVLAMAPRK